MKPLSRIYMILEHVKNRDRNEGGEVRWWRSKIFIFISFFKGLNYKRGDIFTYVNETRGEAEILVKKYMISVIKQMTSEHMKNIQ